MNVFSQHRAAWKYRIAVDQAAANDATAQLLSTRRDCQLAEDALALAAAKVEFLRAEVHLLEQRQTAADEQLARSRAASLRIVVSNLPDDILRCIFTCCAEIPDTMWTELGNGSFNRGRALLPFSIAAVCTRWRRVALDYGGLWTYLSLPATVAVAQRDSHYRRIDQLLSRSQTYSLDVFLYLKALDSSVEDSSWAGKVLSAVSLHARRWRRVEMAFPKLASRSLAGAFKGPLPRLKQLSLRSRDWLDRQGEDSFFLPHAPLLEDLDLSNTGMTVSPVHEGFPSLVSITVTDDMTAESLQQLLEMSKTTVEVLQLGLKFGDPIPSSLSLPRLHTLVLHLGLFFVTLQGTVILNAPMLSSLTLQSADFMYDDDLSALLEHVSATVTELTLYGIVDEDSVDTLTRLRSLSHVVFGNGTFSCDVYDPFFVALSKQVPPVWPRLESIVFYHGEVIPSNGDGIVRLVAARNAPSHSAPPSSVEETDLSERPCRIQEVELPDNEDTPQWLADEVDRLLGNTDWTCNP
ncbi:hypothetical protein EXIGLDRAFT_747648 [Exidia glandulosa HHB12029]|uniref:Uncharacterized protein n=1 Tax=Exidia glandulosa HHB12029 TaxID=1314781 RepID=A0A165KIN3_EXIGL|nr:hypothetical protein EXIGLDRAFT_747648 [Exidia glandulosa HHB12029]